MSISGANGAPPPNPNPTSVPPSVGMPPPPPLQTASGQGYYPHSQAQSPFPNAALPKPTPTNSHHHHHGHHHHHQPQTGPLLAAVNSSAGTGPEYTHAGPSSSLGPHGDRYYSNEPRGPSPTPSGHLQHNGQGSSRREARSSGEVTPGRGGGGTAHGGMGALEHGMPPPPSTSLGSSHG